MLIVMVGVCCESMWLRDCLCTDLFVIYLFVCAEDKCARVSACEANHLYIIYLYMDHGCINAGAILVLVFCVNI